MRPKWVLLVTFRELQPRHLPLSRVGCLSAATWCLNKPVLIYHTPYKCERLPWTRAVVNYRSGTPSSSQVNRSEWSEPLALVLTRQRTSRTLDSEALATAPLGTVNLA